jgi:hypothetical protein
MSGNLGLSVNDLVTIDVTVTPAGATVRNFGLPLIVGPSGVIDVQQRLRSYTSLTGVGVDFSVTDPEFLAADDFFAQSPTPSQVLIGAWAQTATPAVLQGATLTTAQQQLSNFTTVASGGFDISVAGTPKTISGLNFSGATNLNGVASIISAALETDGLTCVWNASLSRFVITTTATGASETLSFATPPGTGTDVSGLLGLTATAGGYVVDGIAAETLAENEQIMSSISNQWYAYFFSFQPGSPPAQSDILATAAQIQAQTPARIMGATVTSTGALSSVSPSDLAFALSQATLNRTFTHYSSTDPNAAASLFGRIATVDYTGADTTINMMYQKMPGVTAETLQEGQAAALKGKNCNVFVNYNNGTAIVQFGTMSDGTFMDQLIGLDAFSNALQTAYFNALLTAGTKVPQTDPGVNILEGALTQVCEQFVTNGLLAPGQWNGPNIGAIKNGQQLTAGYYVFAAAVATQAESTRAARIAPPIQILAKLAGAINTGSVLVNVNQ